LLPTLPPSIKQGFHPFSSSHNQTCAPPFFFLLSLFFSSFSLFLLHQKLFSPLSSFCFFSLCSVRVNQREREKLWVSEERLRVFERERNWEIGRQRFMKSWEPVKPNLSTPPEKRDPDPISGGSTVGRWRMRFPVTLEEISGDSSLDFRWIFTENPQGNFLWFGLIKSVYCWFDLGSGWTN